MGTPMTSRAGERATPEAVLPGRAPSNLRLSWGLLCVFWVAPAACSNGGGDAEDGGGREPTETAFPQCVDSTEGLSRAALFQATLRPLTEDGVFEIPLSATGRVRLVQTVEGGKLTRLSVRKAWGFLISDGSRSVEAESEFSDERFTDTSMRGEYFRDLGFYFPEVVAPRSQRLLETLEVELDGSGRMLRQVVREFSEGRLSLEVEQTAVGTDQIRSVARAGRNGATELIWDTTGSAKMFSPVCGPLRSGTPDSQVRDCTATELAQIQEELLGGLEQGKACIERVEEGSTPDLGAIDGLVERVKKKEGAIKCYTGGESAGYISRNSSGPGSALGATLNVNVGMLSLCDSSFRRSTLFHEMLHLVRGPHDEADEQVFELPAGAIGPLTAALTDPIRACEELCFGDPARVTRCMCAKCLGTKACDDRCRGLPSCVVRNAAGVAVSSEAVGSMCYDPSGVNSPSWHGTHMACTSVCSGGRTCKSYSVSCDDNCK